MDPSKSPLSPNAGAPFRHPIHSVGSNNSADWIRSAAPPSTQPPGISPTPPYPSPGGAPLSALGGSIATQATASGGAGPLSAAQHVGLPNISSANSNNSPPQQQHPSPGSGRHNMMGPAPATNTVAESAGHGGLQQPLPQQSSNHVEEPRLNHAAAAGPLRTQPPRQGVLQQQPFNGAPSSRNVVYGSDGPGSNIGTASEQARNALAASGRPPMDGAGGGGTPFSGPRMTALQPQPSLSGGPTLTTDFPQQPPSLRHPGSTDPLPTATMRSNNLGTSVPVVVPSQQQQPVGTGVVVAQTSGPPTAQPPPAPKGNVPGGAPLPPSTEGQAGPPAPGAAGPGMRELRVEDALLYLDEVKREFRDRPVIYNEFLAIMKNFKSQEVDTPGVIARVSQLFRGYNNLILGFNTFLPDGYKISLADLERQEAERRANEARQKQLEREQLKQAAFKAAQSLPISLFTREAAPQQPPASTVTGPPGGPSPPPTIVPPPLQQQPSQQQQQQQQPHRSGSWGQADGNQPRDQPQNQPPPVQAMAKSPSQPAPPPAAAPKSGPSSRGSQQQEARQAGGQPHQAVEFDHAISYVTTIKRRFANDPNTYHAFLEILHTYQKEQRGIKEVLEQVARLFQDHPDLLKEFTFFLPDAVQEQAKERLHRAAAESESRQAKQRQQQMDQYHQSEGRGNWNQQQQQQPKLIDMTRSQVPQAEPDARSKKRPSDAQQQISMQAPPESFVYNSAVERQFFDAVREALTAYTRDGGQAWAEFLKCLDMYAQDILSRSEMLNLVEPLLGKRNTKLFEEFKRILAAAGSPSGSVPLMEDAWYSVPLSEIDFSRCRRCTPSYRALPRDYPSHPCNDRSEEEAKVLNDVWVSLPVGSEESYTFRHMRRNTYEETLFRVEDERFEIDMVIDSNAATLRRLQLVAEEIATLAKDEFVPGDLSLKPMAESTGMGGKRYQYTFDKSMLGVIHRNTIARIYGDSGQEMLDLMVKNPAVAVPVIVQRLQQKDEEWRAVRLRLNRQWRELVEHNYYKSLDHRGLTWRTTDKRTTSSRTLLLEIKDRSMNGGREGKEAIRQKIEKAKEEHGTFYEVTMADAVTFDLDLTFLPKADRRLFTPHLSILFENVSWVQRDAFRILAFALERGPTSPADKERCHRLWVEFLGPWFNLPLTWMQEPAVAYQESTAAAEAKKAPPPSAAPVVSEDDEEESLEDRELRGNHVVTEELQEQSNSARAGPLFTDHHPIPAGATISTLYGEGKVLGFRKSDQTYAIELSFGAIGYLRHTTVLCTMLPVEKSAYTRQLRSDDHTKLARAADQLSFGTQSLYLFFRLHHMLVERLNIAKHLAYTVADDPTLVTLVEQLPDGNRSAVGKRRYEAYLSLLYALLDGGVGGSEGGKYEDRLRSLLGNGAYELATMDKLIANIWKNLQSLAGDETMWNLIQVYRRHAQAGSFQPEAFRQEAAYLSDGEVIYAFQQCPVAGEDQTVMHIEYLGVIMDEEEGISGDLENYENKMVVEPDEPPAPVLTLNHDAMETSSNKRQRR